jgi:hypothetical protein
VHMLARVCQRVTWVDRPTPSISSGLGVAITAADPATSWDNPSNPPGDGQTAAPHRSSLAAATLLATSHRSRLAAATHLAVSHRSRLAVVTLQAAPLLRHVSTWVARLVTATLRARPASADRARSRSRSPESSNLAPLAWSSRVESGVSPLPT